jgi:hypothetical protein
MLLKEIYKLQHLARQFEASLSLKCSVQELKRCAIVDSAFEFHVFTHETVVDMRTETVEPAFRHPSPATHRSGGSGTFTWCRSAGLAF